MKVLAQVAEALPLRVAVFTCSSWIRTRHVGDPIRFPRAVVVRKSLLPVNMVVINRGPRDASLYWLAVVGIFAKELALRTIKAAEHSGIELAGLVADVMHRPLLFLQIEGSQCKAGIAGRR